MLGGATMDAMLGIIIIWLSANFGLSGDVDVPGVKFVGSAASMLEVSDRRHVQHRNEIVAIYGDGEPKIYVGEKWKEEPVTLSAILVHEMVHHLQDRGNIQYSCPGAREALAFRAQRSWLQIFGRDLESEFGLDPFTIKAMTLCMH